MGNPAGNLLHGGDQRNVGILIPLSCSLHLGNDLIRDFHRGAVQQIFKRTVSDGGALHARSPGAINNLPTLLIHQAGQNKARRGENIISPAITPTKKVCSAPVFTMEQTFSASTLLSTTVNFWLG